MLCGFRVGAHGPDAKFVVAIAAPKRRGFDGRIAPSPSDLITERSPQRCVTHHATDFGDRLSRDFIGTFAHRSHGPQAASQAFFFFFIFSRP